MPTEQRHFFRIQEELFLKYQQVEASCILTDPPDIHFTENPALDLFMEMKRLESDATAVLTAVADHHRPTADYLSILNKKIDLLSGHLVAENLKQSDYPKGRVNLGEGGIAFEAGRAFYKGSYLAMRLVFPATGTCLTIYAQIIRCEESSERYRIAAKFVNVTDQQQQTLSRQIMQSQLATKRRQKNLRSPD